LIIGGVKRSTIAHAPIAVFADIDTLCSAPRKMIAAGFGDILGKFTSVADWRLGRLLWDQPYDESIAQRALNAVWRCVEQAEEIGKATPEGVRRLMEELIESGFCMTDFGSSLPASGTEHHYSHCWEMKLLREGRPAILHGAKVGVASILVAGLYDRIRRLTKRRAQELLEAFRPPAREQEVRRIRSAFGPMADEIIAVQAPFLGMSGDDFDRLKRKILEQWPQIQDVARQVPTTQRLAEMLQGVGGPVDAKGLGLTEEDLALATNSGHYLRGHFTVRRLAEMLNQSFDHLGNSQTGRQSGRLDAYQIDEA
jgi:glycerol-1-phosphate dehydrogenase [NAD(P)+]